MSNRVEVSSDLQSTECTPSDRRQHERKSFRTVGELHVVEGGATKFSAKVWTQDVSVSGAKLVAKQPIEAKKFLLALIVPQQRDTILECEVVSDKVEVTQMFNGTERLSYIYCVRFLRKADRSEIEAASLIDQTEINPDDVVNSMQNNTQTTEPTDKKRKRRFIFSF